jgi:hypothetical protein
MRAHFRFHGALGVPHTEVGRGSHYERMRAAMRRYCAPR